MLNQTLHLQRQEAKRVRRNKRLEKIALRTFRKALERKKVAEVMRNLKPADVLTKRSWFSRLFQTIKLFLQNVTRTGIRNAA